MGTKAIRVAPELQLEIEQFYYHEAELLDDHRYPEWLDLFSNDARYWMPTRTNRLLREHDKEASAEGELALFVDNKKTLGWRVKQMDSLTHRAENPRSRTFRSCVSSRPSECSRRDVCRSLVPRQQHY